MKSTYFGFLLIWSSFSCLGESSIVSGKFTNHGGSGMVYLYEAYGTDYFLVDSTSLNDGDFKFRLEDVQRGFYRIGISKEVSIVAVLGEPNLVMAADLQDPESVEIQGSKENELYNQYREINLHVYQQKFAAEQVIKSGYKGGDAEDYMALVKGLKNRFDSLDDFRNESYRKLAQQNPDNFIGKICRFLAYDDAASYISYPEFRDQELWRGDMIQAKIFIYFQRLIPRSINHWTSNTNKILREMEPKSQEKELVQAAIISLFGTSTPEYASRLANVYYEEYPNSRYAAVVRATLPKGPPAVGDQAPEIELEQVNGELLKLSSLKGKVVLVDFWASWCRPCRLENPNLVRAFKKYKDKGFDIYSVSLDHGREPWIKAIEKDKLTWQHVSDLRGWHSAASKTYKLKAIPASYLVDQNGTIIAQNLRGEKLTSTLEKIFD